MPKTDEARRIWTDMLAWIGRSVRPQKPGPGARSQHGAQKGQKALVEH
jgi:hypothetical protein